MTMYFFKTNQIAFKFSFNQFFSVKVTKRVSTVYIAFCSLVKIESNFTITTLDYQETKVHERPYDLRFLIKI
jgi:hypothetical protein